jgi:hypothetical protein
MKNWIKPYILVIVIILSIAQVTAMERRRDQFQSDFGYLLAPFPFILPGVGTGVGLLMGANNVFDTHIDLNTVFIQGDVEGRGIILTDMHLISQRLLFDVVSFGINKAQQLRYSERGMNSQADIYSIVELADSNLLGGRLILTSPSRMFELFIFGFATGFKVDAVRNSDGDLDNQINNPIEQSFLTADIGFLFDYTDDRLDPRQGINVQITRGSTPASSDTAVDFYTINYSATAYIPILAYSTWAFNYYRSDAHVISQGVTNTDILKTEYGCIADVITGCSTAVQEIVKDQIATNTYGNATSLGGRSRLRSFDEGRFNGAHTEFLGSEFRWNLTDENTPFDLYFMRDIRTGIQLVAFYEIGTVADVQADLWKKHRSSTGIGARIITGSGFVYRFDIATGEEGESVVLFFGYPWGSF